MWSRVLLGLSLAAVALSATAAPELVVSSAGKLAGAKGVEVGGVYYDVEFIDGTCAALFNGCDSASDFDFQTAAQAEAAAAALLDQVLVDGGEGQFDSQPWMTEGCEDGEICYVVTPFDYPNEWGQAIAQTAINYVVNSSDWFAQSAEDTNVDYHLSPHITWAVWRPAMNRAIVVGAREWRPLTETTNLTWQEVYNTCGATGYCEGGAGAASVLNGWHWANLYDVRDLFEFLIEPDTTNFSDVLSVYVPPESADLKAAVNLLGATWVDPQFQATFGWSWISGGTGMLPHLFDALGPEVDWAVLNYSMGVTTRDVRFGVWLYRPTSASDPATMLKELAEAVAGIGRGKSLSDKIELAQVYYDVPDLQATCAILTDFSNEVRAKRGKKIAVELADELTEDAQAIMSAMECE